jgi:hypothetical protein
MRKRPYKRNLIAVGLLLLALGAYTIYDSNSASYYHSTFNLIPLKFFKITDNLKDKATINGQVRETSGRTVSFLIWLHAHIFLIPVGRYLLSRLPPRIRILEHDRDCRFYENISCTGQIRILFRNSSRSHRSPRNKLGAAPPRHTAFRSSIEAIGSIL